MSRRVHVLLLSVAIVVAACQDSPNPAGPEPDASSVPNLAALKGQAVPGRYIVMFQDAVGSSAAVAGSMVAGRGRLHLVYDGAVKGFAADLSDAAAAELRRDPRVSFVEPDRVVSTFGVQSPAPSWGLDRIDQRALPLSHSYNYGTTGSGVRIYVMDTGILLSHTDFGGRASSSGLDILHDGQVNTDCNGHGTHVAGTAAGTKYGVAKSARLVSVRVLDCSGFGLNSWVIAGINWVTQNGVKPAVVNMSLGGGLSGALNQAVTNSVAAGFSYSIAAGNGNADACQVSPASTPNALTVGASDITDTRASFSNFGKCLDVFAPGVNIVSDFRGSNTAIKTLNGTSMAAPHVAGAAALYLQNNPTGSPANVAHALLTTATAGVIKNAGAASPTQLLYTATVTGPAQDLNPVARFTVICFTRTCDFNGTSSSDDHGITGYQWTLGDGTTASTATVHKVYAANGSYNIKLTVTDAAGHSATLTRSISLPAPANQPPVARFTVLCNGIDCSFDAITSTDDFGIASYKWTFGDGKSGTGVAPKHHYNTLGTFTVTLTVTDAYGLTGKQSQAVSIGLP